MWNNWSSWIRLASMINSDLKWDYYHVTAITSKAGKDWFMKQLRRAGVCQDDLLYRQLCDLFSNIRAHVGRQALRKNRRNNLKIIIIIIIIKGIYIAQVRKGHKCAKMKMFSVVLFRSFWQHTVRRSTSYMYM